MTSQRYFEVAARIGIEPGAYFNSGLFIANRIEHEEATFDGFHWLAFIALVLNSLFS